MSSVWEPMSLRNAVNRLMEDSFVRPYLGWTPSRDRDVPALPIDVLSTDEALVVTANVPGLSPDDVDITIEGDTLTIRGELKQSTVEKGNWVMQERYRGPFRRVLTLNIPVQADKAEALFKDGVLTLTLPKADKVRPRIIKVRTDENNNQ
jgi:HSP20 family protein